MLQYCTFSILSLPPEEEKPSMQDKNDFKLDVY